MNWFWHALWICLIVIPTTILWLVCVYDIVFRAHDVKAWARIGWLVLVLVVPVIGALIYLAVRARGLGGTESYRDLEVARASGLLSDSEYEDQRRRLGADPSAR